MSYFSILHFIFCRNSLYLQSYFSKIYIDRLQGFTLLHLRLTSVIVFLIFESESGQIILCDRVYVLLVRWSLSHLFSQRCWHEQYPLMIYSFAGIFVDFFFKCHRYSRNINLTFFWMFRRYIRLSFTVLQTFYNPLLLTVRSWNFVRFNGKFFLTLCKYLIGWDFLKDWVSWNDFIDVFILLQWLGFPGRCQVLVYLYN